MGRQPKHAIEVQQAISREYHALKSAGKLPDRWVEQKAKDLGLHVQSVYRYIELAKPADTEQARSIRAGCRFDHEAAMRGPGSRTVHATKWEQKE